MTIPRTTYSKFDITKNTVTKTFVSSNKINNQITIETN